MKDNKVLLSPNIPSDVSTEIANLVDSRTSSSDVVTFTRKSFATEVDATQDDSMFTDDVIADLETDAVPLRTSTPIATETIPAELDDLAVQMIHDLLHKHHLEIAGMQFPGFGEFQGSQLPRYASAEAVRFAQILNVGDHWICVTNIFGSTTHDLHIYDSLQRKRLSDNAVVQLSAILRDDNTSETLKIHVRKFVRQPARSRACGLYVAAAAFACCNGDDPTGMCYDVEELREAIASRVLNDEVNSLPGTKRWEVKDISVYSTAKVYCSCHKSWRAASQMVQCSDCGHWFHNQCIGDVPSAVMQSTVVPWTGPCCERMKMDSTVELSYDG